MTKAKKAARKVSEPPTTKRLTEADKELGKRIRLRRLEMKMSQEELGKQLGVSFQQIQKYERGKNRVGASRLVNIAKALDVSPSFFYAGDKDNREVESLLFMDSSFSLRLLRSYAKVKDQNVQRSFVNLMEAVAEAIGEPVISK